MDMPLRKVLNLTYDWLIEGHAYDSDTWEKNYRRVFDRSVSNDEYEQGYDEVDTEALGITPPSAGSSGLNL